MVVKDGDSDIAFLSLTDPEFDLSDRGVEGREAAPPVDVFLTTDRGAYRAGETVYATALARDARGGGDRRPAADRDPEAPGWRGIFAPAGRGCGRGRPCVRPADRRVGPARGLAAGEFWPIWRRRPLAAKTFLVEDFLPERIDFDLTLADAPDPAGRCAAD